MCIRDSREGPRTSLGFRPAGALHSLQTDRDSYKRWWDGDEDTGKRNTRRRRGGNPDDDKKTYEKKLKDYQVNRADFDKTVLDSVQPMPPRNRPSWASPTASGWGMAPYGRTQEFVPPERPVEKKRFNFGIYDRKFKKHDGLWSTHPCLLYTSPSPRDRQKSRMPSSA